MSNTRQTIAQAQGVYKTYHLGREKVEALKDISLNVDRGETLAITGPSGCGKTTLLNLLGGLDTPTKGTVTFQSRDLSRMRDQELSQLRRKHIGFIFQFYNLIPNRTALQNVALPLFFAGQPKEKRQQTAINALRKVKLANRANHYPNELSGGEQQRVAIARALAIQPTLILADEPTGNLDTETGNLVTRQLIQQANQRITIIIATHDPKLAQKTNRTIQLTDGTRNPP